MSENATGIRYAQAPDGREMVWDPRRDSHMLIVGPDEETAPVVQTIRAAWTVAPVHGLLAEFSTTMAENIRDAYETMQLRYQAQLEYPEEEDLRNSCPLLLTVDEQLIAVDAVPAIRREAQRMLGEIVHLGRSARVHALIATSDVHGAIATNPEYRSYGTALEIGVTSGERAS